MKNNFEQLIKNSLENHEAPYEAGAWEKFEKAQTSTPFYKSNWFIGGAALIVILASVALFNLDINPSEKNITQSIESPIKEKQTVVTENNNEQSSISIVEKEENHQEEKTKSTDKNRTLKIKKEQGKNNITSTLSEETINEQDQPLALIEEDFENNNSPLVNNNRANSTTNEPNLQEEKAAIASFFIENNICAGNNINLLVDNPIEGFDYLWKVNNEEVSKESFVSLKATQTGENSASLLIKKDGLIIDEKKKTFTVLDSPSDNIKIELDQTSLINKLEFKMDDLSNKVSWNFGDGTTSNENNASHTYKKAGQYVCNFTVTAINGCSASFERNINVKGYYNLRTDYGFSPGKRDNVNDVFIPVELQELNLPFELSIYARNGQLLYATTSLDKPWDGKMKDGSTCTFGSYVWVVTLTNELGVKEVYKGTITNVSN